MPVESRFSVVDISNLTTPAAIETALNAELDVLEGLGFVVTNQDHRGTFIYLTAILATHLGGAAGVETLNSLWVPPRTAVPIGGTWTEVIDGNEVPMLSRAQADGTGTVSIPIVIPGASAVSGRGHKLESVGLVYAVVTAAMDALSDIELRTFTPVLAAALTNGDPILGAVSTTVDVLHDAAGRLAVGEHHMLTAVDTPVYRDAAIQYQLDITFDAAATSDLDIYGCLVNYSTTR